MSFQSVSELPLRIVGVNPENQPVDTNWLGRRIRSYSSCLWHFLKNLIQRIYDIAIRIITYNSSDIALVPVEEKHVDFEYEKPEEKHQVDTQLETKSPDKMSPVSTSPEDKFYEGDHEGE